MTKQSRATFGRAETVNVTRDPDDTARVVIVGSSGVVSGLIPADVAKDLAFDLPAHTQIGETIQLQLPRWMVTQLHGCARESEHDAVTERGRADARAIREALGYYLEVTEDGGV